MYDPEHSSNCKTSPLNRTHGALTALAAAFLLLSVPARLKAQLLTEPLPDAPSARLFPATALADASPLPDPGAQQQSSPAAQTTAPALATPPLPPTIAAPTQQPPATAPLQPVSDQAASVELPPCPKNSRVPFIFLPTERTDCQEQDQLQLIVNTGHIKPLTSPQKGLLATRAVIDPFNLLTIAAFSGISTAADSHTVYGPGFAGWGRLAGYSLAEDIQGEFTGTYLIASLAHEDPRYHRMPGAPTSRRIEHALLHTVISQHDDGSVMINYETLINYPLSAEISNLYVPGVGVNAPDTAKRVLVGYATDPIGPLVAEFLPDFAKRVHIHIVFAQQILNRIALGSGAQTSSF